jgi:hypothetical protein
MRRRKPKAAPGLYAPPEQPSKAVLAERLADGEESGLHRFLNASSDLQDRLNKIELPDTISFQKPDDSTNKDG